MASTDVARPVDREGWSKFVDKVAQLEPKEQRAIASIFGAVVADAAGKILHVLFVLQLLPRFDLVVFSGTCTGQALHWIYNIQTLKSIVDGVSEPEFMEPSHNPFYVVENGAQSTYGDQFLVQLESLAECGGL